MVAPQTKPISFEQFLEWYPEDGKRYELIEGVIVEMLPTGSHEDISGFLVAELNFKIRKQNLPYSIPKNCLLKPLAPRSGYLPDVAVINREYIKNEPLWEKSSVIQDVKTVPLVIEVVSTNWRDDYGHKFVEYEAMGIAEYWLVDYRALGAVRSKLFFFGIKILWDLFGLNIFCFISWIRLPIFLFKSNPNIFISS